MTLKMLWMHIRTFIDYQRGKYNVQSEGEIKKWIVFYIYFTEIKHDEMGAWIVRLILKKNKVI